MLSADETRAGALLINDSVAIVVTLCFVKPPGRLSRSFPAEIHTRKLCHLAATNLVRASGLSVGRACHHFLK
jgi:hypothetical protein